MAKQKAKTESATVELQVNDYSLSGSMLNGVWRWRSNVETVRDGMTMAEATDEFMRVALAPARAVKAAHRKAVG